jgi:hypothetical protein
MNTIEEINDTIITTVKRPRGRPRVPEDQKKKSDAAYHIAYYFRTKLSETVRCELCNCKVTNQKMKRHQESKKCKELSSYRVMLDEVDDEEI